ncbi:tetratricopeptide repeat protein [Actinoplanes awajinensis]|uniref:tetratricopeptide repeat protein n=1 Tax=Actinoplanes awajinensis TaxID=135946 RepID=UPI0018DE39A5|nr:tetratricopeptide repeat protein [Actinoplanes awajinensis]
MAVLRKLVASGVWSAERPLSRALRQQSGYLAAVARHAEAVAAAEEAVVLARGDSSRARPLAVALAGLAIRLLAAGRAAEGLATAREVAAVGGQPQKAVARALTDLSDALAEAGEPEAAVEPSERAVAMWRSLGAEPEIGAALTGHADRLAALGRWADAVAYAAEAVEHHRAAAASPVSAEAERKLALVLTSYAVTLNRVGREQEALAAEAEAAALRGR